MLCNLCNCSEYKIRDGSVRDNKNLEILECLNCGLVYLSSLEHINEDFYEESNIHEEFNFGKWQKDTDSDDQRRYKFVKNLITNKKILDFGSGNGGFLSYSKKNCFVCLWCRIGKSD